MSRVGKQIVHIPGAVKTSLNGRVFHVEGPKGKLDLKLPEYIDVKVEKETLTCVLKSSTKSEAGAMHGLMRSHIANMVKGVTEGFKKDLEINGVGFRANLKGKELELLLGFSHPVLYKIPEGINVAVEKQTKLTITGADRQLVGQTAAEIRRYRKPEPYKGKGIKYSTEVIRRKAGKAAAGSAS
jgi:large subunit ribosomal protein L6